jgi:hydrogenase maturation protease
MKRTLVVALGNQDVASDAIGPHIARALLRRGDLPDDVEVICAGTDLLRVAEQLRERDIIVLIDAALAASDGEDVVFCEHGSPRLDDAQRHAHHLSAVQALELIRWSDQSVRRARCYWYLPVVTPLHTAARSAL